MANFHQPEGASRSRPRVSSLPEITEDQLVSMEASTHVHCPTNPVALGAGATVIVNVKTVRPRFIICHAGTNNQGFLLQL